jgi:NAD+ kinase
LPDAADLVSSLVRYLGLEGRSWSSAATEIGRVQDNLVDTSLVVVVGGDGTILRTVRVIAPYSIPIVGVNMGRVGFMTELGEHEAIEKLEMYVDGVLRIEKRMMLEASVGSESEESPRLTVHALNDVVVGRGETARLLDIDTSVDRVALTSYRADAVIVATATGSTGYALSAGGPILYPEARVMLVQPVAAHTGLRDALVLPEESVVALKAGDGHEASLTVDGFSDMVLSAGDVVTVKSSPHVALFMRAHAPSTFYTALMQRLGLVYRSGSPGTPT